jgi:hypothetical protein
MFIVVPRLFPLSLCRHSENPRFLRFLKLYLSPWHRRLVDLEDSTLKFPSEITDRVIQRTFEIIWTKTPGREMFFRGIPGLFRSTMFNDLTIFRSPGLGAVNYSISIIRPKDTIRVWFWFADDHL